MKKVLIIYFFFFSLIIYAQEVLLSVDSENYNIFVSSKLQSYDFNEVLDSLNNGFEAEIFFEFRLYEKATGFLSFLGDKLIIEEKPFYIAGIDIFENTYIITTHDNEVFSYDTETEFIKNFFRITSYPIPGSIWEEDKEFYVLARIQLNHVKLVPPLDLISLFYSTGFITDWAEIQLNGNK
jgi:hypothetical protein